MKVLRSEKVTLSLWMMPGFRSAFGVQGEIVKPFCIRVYGDVEFAKLTFIKHNLPVEFVKHISNEFHYFNSFLLSNA